jgi:hypothetical protein
VDVLREQRRTELVVLEGLQMVDLELVVVAAGKLLQEALLIAV